MRPQLLSLLQRTNGILAEEANVNLRGHASINWEPMVRRAEKTKSNRSSKIRRNGLDPTMDYIAKVEHTNEIVRPKCQVNVEWRPHHNGRETSNGMLTASRSCAPCAFRINTIWTAFPVYNSFHGQNPVAFSMWMIIRWAVGGGGIFKRCNRGFGCWRQAFASILLFQVANIFCRSYSDLIFHRLWHSVTGAHQLRHVEQKHSTVLAMRNCGKY